MPAHVEGLSFFWHFFSSLKEKLCENLRPSLLFNYSSYFFLPQVPAWSEEEAIGPYEEIEEGRKSSVIELSFY